MKTRQNYTRQHKTRALGTQPLISSERKKQGDIIVCFPHLPISSANNVLPRRNNKTTSIARALTGRYLMDGRWVPPYGGEGAPSTSIHSRYRRQCSKTTNFSSASAGRYSPVDNVVSSQSHARKPPSRYSIDGFRMGQLRPYCSTGRLWTGSRISCSAVASLHQPNPLRFCLSPPSSPLPPSVPWPPPPIRGL